MPEDATALATLDTSHTSAQVLRVDACQSAFTLGLQALDEPFHHRYLLEEVEVEACAGLWLVLESDGRIVGLVAALHHEWNRRTELRHLYLDPAWRGQGWGAKLVEQVWNWSRQQASRGLWVETQHCNPAAVAFYQHLGFSLCGLDTSLYDTQGAGAGQVAIYLFKAHESKECVA